MVNREQNALASFRVSLQEQGDELILRFDCQAEDISHAIDQARDAHRGCRIVSANWIGHDSPLAIVPDLEGDFTLQAGHQGGWITVDNASVRVYRTDEGVVADIYPLGCESAACDSSAHSMRTELATSALGDPDNASDVRDAINALLPHQV